MSNDYDQDVYENGDVTSDAPAVVPDTRSRFTRLVARGYDIIGIKTDVKPVAPQVDTSRWISVPFYRLGKATLGRSAEINDRDCTLPKAMKYMSTLSPDSTVTTNFNKAAIELLDNNQRPRPKPLRHATHTPSERHPYARSVDKPNPLRTLPDLGTVFDGLLRAKDRHDHPNGISGMTFAFASIISLCLFRTNPSKPEYNETSPYLDLSPLYGANKEEEDLVRNKDGRGWLSPDCFFEDRVMFLPPAVSALLILWNRNHNYIASNLLLLNEKKKWRDPSTFSSDGGSLHPQLTAQDDEIFNTARLINCANFKNVVVEDFLKGLLGLANVGNSANLDLTKVAAAKGRDHYSTVESSLLYHWSAITSQVDVEWTQRTIETAFSGKSFDTITPDDFADVMENFKTETDTNRRRRSFIGFRRGNDDKFSDNDIASVLLKVTESIAGAPRACGIAPCMRIIEMMVMQQARDWNVCSLNDFRRFLGLKPFGNFKEWNSTPDIAAAASSLYQDVANLELYPGLQAEDAMPGSGFSMGYTMTYGLLVDIVTSVRSDPSFTTLTANELTEWGYNECTMKPNNGAFGAVFPKVLLRNLPTNYPYDSIYALFPFTVPAMAKKVLDSSPSSDSYNRERLRPRQTKILETRSAISYVSNNPAIYPTTYGRSLRALTNGYGYLLGFDDEQLHDADQIMTLYALIPDRGELLKHTEYFARTAGDSIQTKSHPKAANDTTSIDVVQDVINATVTRWLCDLICGVPRDSKKQPLKDSEVYNMFVDIHTFIFQTPDPNEGWTIREKALAASALLNKHIEGEFKAASAEFFEESIINRVKRVWKELNGGLELGKTSPYDFLTRLEKSSTTSIGNLQRAVGSERLKNLDEFKGLTLPDPREPEGKQAKEFETRRLVANVLGVCVMSSVNFAQVCAHAVDFYLNDNCAEERKVIAELSKRNDAADNPKIMGYIREAQRLEASPRLLRNVERDDTIKQGHGLPDIAVQKGDRILADFKKAHMNVMDFHDPTRIDWSRKTSSIQGLGLHKCPGISFVDATMPEVFKAIFRLDNLRRKDGRVVASNTHAVPLDTDSEFHKSAADKSSRSLSSLILEYDGYKPTPEWEVPYQNRTTGPVKPLWTRLSQALIAIIAAILLCCILYLLVSFRVYLPSLHMHPWKSKTLPPPPSNVACADPTVIFDPYHIVKILPDRNGKPKPFEYTHKNRKPHRLIVVDVDRPDMRLELFVDGHSQGITPETKLDRSIDCGEDVNTCLTLGFSAGSIVVPPGKRNVKIIWAAYDFINGTEEIDWGTERSRRFLLQREYCA